MPVTGSFAGAINDLAPTLACSASLSTRTQAEVFFSFTPPTTGTWVFQETTSADVVMWVGAACDGSCLAIVDDPEQLSVSLTAGQTYFFVIEPFGSATTFTIVVN